MRWLEQRPQQGAQGPPGDAEEKRKATRAEAAAQVNAEPIYQVLRWLT
jgi:hypothetical protein